MTRCEMPELPVMVFVLEATETCLCEVCPPELSLKVA